MLRGINVSGTKKVSMQELKSLYEGLNLENVRTYIQSGNVVFTSSHPDPVYLTELINKALYTKYAFDAPVFISTATELEAALTQNPFLQRKSIEKDKLHIIFLQHMPSLQDVEKCKALTFEPDEFMIDDKIIYLYCPNGYGRTKLTNTFFERKLQIMATTRNWRTVNELLKMANEK
jgi:uncharacterized protein (DUF1697 family)